MSAVKVGDVLLATETIATAGIPDGPVLIAGERYVVEELDVSTNAIGVRVPWLRDPTICPLQYVRADAFVRPR